MFPAGRLEDPGVGEAACAVQGDGAGVVGIADHGDHLAQAQGFASDDQGVQQGAGDAAAAGLGGDIDRVLDHVAIGLAGAERAGVGVADHGAVDLGDQPGQAQGLDGGEAGRHLDLVRRLQLEGAASVGDAFGIDGGDRRHVGRGRLADLDLRPHQPSSRAAWGAK